MIFRKYYKNNGIIILDILIALALAALFIAIIATASIDAHSIFDNAKDRNLLLKEYEAGIGISSTILYGNDHFQTNIENISTSSKTRFSQIKMNTYSDLLDKAGTPLCAVDFVNKNIVGSYIFDYTSNFIKSNSITASITPILLPINPLLPLTDLEVRNGIAYIGIDSSTASDQDFLIVDIKNSDSPKIVSSINTGPGIISIALAGKRIYAGAPSTAAQLHIIRLDGLNNLILEKKYKLPLPYATATAPLSSSIFYSNNYIFLGTEKWEGEEFNIIDVTDPLVPFKVGGLEINSKVNDILVQDNLAYIASGNQEQLLVVDIRNLEQPIIKEIFSPSGSSRQDGKVISSFENVLNFGRTSGGYNIIGDHEAFGWLQNPFIDFDISSTTITHSTSSLESINSKSIDIPGGVYGIISDRSNIYLATRQINKEFQIFNHNFEASTSIGYSLPIAPQMMTCDGDKLYILAHTAPIIYKIIFK